jgi:hypothetical protein
MLTCEGESLGPSEGRLTQEWTQEWTQELSFFAALVSV